MQLCHGTAQYERDHGLQSDRVTNVPPRRSTSLRAFTVQSTQPVCGDMVICTAYYVLRRQQWVSHGAVCPPALPHNVSLPFFFLFFSSVQALRTGAKQSQPITGSRKHVLSYLRVQYYRQRCHRGNTGSSRAARCMRSFKSLCSLTCVRTLTKECVTHIFFCLFSTFVLYY